MGSSPAGGQTPGDPGRSTEPAATDPDTSTVTESNNSESPAVLVSACLLGVCCRYDGTSRDLPGMTGRLIGSRIVPICPEQLGGLPTPRTPCNIEGGTGADVLAGRARVVSEKGDDRTGSFIRGASESLRLARRFGAARAMMKARSPSCDAASGVTSAMLRAEGIVVENAD